MSNVVVYVFLLDNLQGFSHTLNKTVYENADATHTNIPGTIQQCDPISTNEILNAVSKELDLEVTPMFKNWDRSYSSHQPHYSSLYDDSPEMLKPFIETKYTESNTEFYAKSIDTFEFDSNQAYSYESIENFTRKDTVSKAQNIAPFLVAIFETVSNVTAQTCAGTLLSPHWVLTAANCVNIFSKLYAVNATVPDNSPGPSLYTVVAGATDPLIDGSAHNVSAIIIQKNSNSSKSRRSTLEPHGFHFAMMRIEPAFEGASLALVEDKVKKGDVMIYGWMLSKNESGMDTLSMANVSARILTEAECQAMYSFYNNEAICFFNNDKSHNISQLNSGGPVLMQQDGEVRMLAVSQTDDNVAFAYPLYDHIDWIKNQLLSE